MVRVDLDLSRSTLPRRTERQPKSEAGDWRGRDGPHAARLTLEDQPEEKAVDIPCS